MKKLLFSLALFVMSVSTLYAQAVAGPSDTAVSKLPEPSTLILGIAGISAVALWLRSRR